MLRELAQNRLLLVAAMIGFCVAPWPNSRAEDSHLATQPPVREHLLMDFGWRFMPGNATDPAKDFDPANSFFTYLAKAGSGAGAAAADFDDRGWRVLDLPHDWAVAAPFDSRGSASHGYKAVGPGFPASSVGWYRKKFSIPASDLGRHITVEFDGVFRDSMVWVNGFYLGRESSGYSGFGYDLTDLLNYGGENVIAVRADASIEEGWFYEGAGIYRHVWLDKTSPLHVAKWGTFITTELKQNAAEITARVTVNNDDNNAASFEIEENILDPNGHSVATGSIKSLSLGAGETGDFSSVLTVTNPSLWSCESPSLYKLVTTIHREGSNADEYETTFGIRTLRWDANEGFFLNGKRVELKGTCDHQDHAGVGVAVPDALNAFRVAQLKKMGSNAIRTSHNPPTPELLDACDRMGMLVMDENRRMGTSAEVLDQLRRLMLRDRNHPCVVIWSIGNEEWNIEGNEKGARITATMQRLAQQLDPTRRFTAAIDSGWGKGSSVSIDVMGFNYFTHGDNDKFHHDFPDKPSVATEDASTLATRGIYVADRDHQHLTAYDENKPGWGSLAEESWSHYAERPYVAGLFQWTGFDYRGEETPFNWPAISSQFGILDTCGFPKDNFYYYQAWWSDRPVLHLFPHWNWPGREGREIDVWVHSNCEEVELFLNGQSQGRKAMKKNSHLAWKVKYAPGTLLARGYRDGKEILTDQVETTGEPAAIRLMPDRQTIQADREDVSVITVQATDTQGRAVPVAGNEITFSLTGPGRIIGVGNGDPASHEPDQMVDKVFSLPLTNWRMKMLAGATNQPEVEREIDDSNWEHAFDGRENAGGGGGTGTNATVVYRASFIAQSAAPNQVITLILRSLGDHESIYLNGNPLVENAPGVADREIKLSAERIRAGTNIVAIVATPLVAHGNRGGQSHNPGLVKMIVPAPEWKRSLFNGLAQVIVQSTGQAGEILLTARAAGLSDAVLRLNAERADLRAAVP